MAILICSATAKELAALAPDLFPKPEILPEMQPISGKLNDLDAFFIVTGTGPVNAALSVGYCLGIIHEHKDRAVSGILCAGLANAFNLDKTPLLSTWLVSREIWPEYGLNDGIQVTARAFSAPLWSRQDGESIFDSIDLELPTDLGSPENCQAMQWPHCSSLTVAGVTASFARRDSLYGYFHAELENMEGFAVGYAAKRASLPCVEIRVVAAKAGPRRKEEKDHEGALKVMSKILPALKIY